MIQAFEVTKLVHGREAALSALEAASPVFGERRLPSGLLASSDIPRVSAEKADAVPATIVEKQRLEDGIPAFELFAEIDLCDSGSAARRLIRQGGAYVNEDRINDMDFRICAVHLEDGGILLEAGKKKVHRIKVDRSIPPCRKADRIYCGAPVVWQRLAGTMNGAPTGICVQTLA